MTASAPPPSAARPPSAAVPDRRYPPAERGPDADALHGREVADPYRWLEDPADPRTVAWAAAQDELTGDYLSAAPGRDAWRDRLTALLRAGAVGVPTWRSGRAFYTRRDPDAEHAVLLVREPDGRERVLVDPTVLDPTGTTTLDAWSPSIEGDRLAYQVSAGGDEESSLYVVAVADGAVLDGPVDRCRYSPVAWLPGGAELVYVRRLAPDRVPAGEEQFHRRVWRHRVGTDPDTDVLLHGDGLDPTNYYDAHVSRDGRWLTVSASAGTAPRDDVWLADLTVEPIDLRPVQVGVDARCSAWVSRDRLWLFTDRDAPRGRLCVTDPRTPAYDDWRDAVPEATDEVLDDVALLDAPDGGLRVLAVHGRDATSRLSLLDPDDPTGARAPVPTPGPGTVSGVHSDPAGGPRAWLGWTDFGTAPSVLTWSLAEPADPPTTWQAAPGGPVPGLNITETEVTSADGTPVHLFVIAPAGHTPATGPRACVLYGYGGFDVSLTPAYSATTLAWVAGGGVWVVANLRGGSERGQEWHRAGMRERKQNVFDDFAAAAAGLVAAGWTTPDRLAVMGGSNGGLLVGAALTQHPEQMAAVVCSAPLLDMVRYEQHGLGRTWNDEYGTAADPTELGWLLGYSPYHHVTSGTAYPATLFTTFDSDTRVDPLHARKMCAALQHATTGAGPVLLRREVDVGHGARSVSRTAGLAADQLAFLAAETGGTVRPA